MFKFYVFAVLLSFSFMCLDVFHVVMEQIFGMAEKEMEYRVELFNK